MYDMSCSWTDDFPISEDPILTQFYMNRLGGVKQLGQVPKFCPGATHTRLNHMGYAAKLMKLICNVLASRGTAIRSNEGIQSTKIHDCGQPAYGHAAEYLLMYLEQEANPGTKPLTHNDRNLILLDAKVPGNGKRKRTLSEVLRTENADPKIVKEFLTKRKPDSNNFLATMGYDIISHKLMGADVLAYLEMDAKLSGYWQVPPFAKRFIRHAALYSDGYGLDVSKKMHHLDNPITMAKSTLETYVGMHENRYWHALSLIYERKIQRSLESAIRGGLINKEDVWLMQDGGIDLKLGGCEETHPEAHEYFMGYFEAKPFLPGIVLKLKGRKRHVLDNENLVEISEQEKETFLKLYHNPTRLTVLEKAVESKFGIPMLCAVLPDPNKMKFADVPFYDGKPGAVGTLHNEYPKFIENLHERFNDFFSVRFHFHPDNIYEVNPKWRSIWKFIQDEIKKEQEFQKSRVKVISSN